VLPELTEAMSGAWFLAPTIPNFTSIYDAEYFRRYRERDQTPMGAKLTRARVELVRRHARGLHTVDVGVGGGRFMDELPCKGHDINPAALEWMNGRHWDYSRVPVLTFWDSLEHVFAPETYLVMADRWVFISMPIYRDLEHVLSSKHLKPNEHLWYFTRDGLVTLLRRTGFELVEESDVESALGREDVMSFAFRRVR